MKVLLNNNNNNNNNINGSSSNNNNRETMATKRRQQSRGGSSSSIWILTCFLSSVISFYGGICIGWHMDNNNNNNNNNISSSSVSSNVNSISKTNEAAPIIIIEGLKLEISKLKSEILILLEKKKNNDNDNNSNDNSNGNVNVNSNKPPFNSDTFDTKHTGMSSEGIHKLSKLKEDRLRVLDEHENENSNSNTNTNTDKNNDNPFNMNLNNNIFDIKHTGKFISGMNMIDRNEFAKKYDVGVPLDESKQGNDHVVILYNDPKSFPTSTSKTKTSTSTKSTSTSSSSNDVDIATENCDIMNVILTQPNDGSGRKQCIAIMGQYESFHIQKFMRLPLPLEEDGGGRAGTGINSSLPLRIVNRGMQMNGRRSIKVPLIQQTKQHWNNLIQYINSLDDVLNELKPILKNVSKHNNHNTIIVLVCNFGQSELLMNFVCNARAKGLGELLKNIILFATDEETLELGQFLGITTYYSKAIFELMPKNAAKAYADKTFKKIMAAKVYCVHLVSQLGYDILFQDVDVIWYKDPLSWFHNASNPYYDFDMYYQDDGNHGLYYAPYSANTGFYFIRNNPETQYFFNSLLMNGDLIISTSSHQIALISLLNEHTSMYGLKVKIWERNLDEFPGGYTFHHKKDYMKKLVKNEVEPYIFHMSWTKNKNDKVLFYEQLGEWYLEDTCQGITKSEIDMTFGKKNKGGANIDHCCSAKPFVNCHYKDKPSKIPCKDSEPIDKNGRSFW